MKHPRYLAAIDLIRKRVFVLAPPLFSAIRIDGKWEFCPPLSDQEILKYQLVTDFDAALLMVNEAEYALEKELTKKA